MFTQRNRFRTVFTIASLVLLVLLARPAEAQTWSQQSPAGTPPSGRQAATYGYDAVNDRLILFSGEDAGGLPRPQDVWVLVNATGAGGTPSWLELFPTGGPPPGRWSGTAVYDSGLNELIVFGGCAGNCSPAYADTWVLTNANGLGGAPQWILRASAAFGRNDHSAVLDATNHRMIIFGGDLAFPGTNLNDVWVYDILTDSWQQLSPTGAPPAPRAFTPAAYDPATNRMIIFGGNQGPDCCTIFHFNDVWVLTNANGMGGTPQWMQLSPAGALPSPRATASAVYVPATNRMILFGGTFGTSGQSPYTFFDEVWVLEGANGTGGTPQWVQLAPAGGPPPGRGLHAAGYLPGANRMVIAMGRRDVSATSTLLFNDAWALVFNQAPTADAGADQTVECTCVPATTVQLDGSASSDADAGDTLVHTWSGAFPEGGGTVTGANPTVTLPLGTHTITLRVDDGNGGTASDTVQISVVVRVEGLSSPMAPLAPEGDAILLPDKAFKQSRTIPLKLQLFCGGTSLSDFDVAAPQIVGLMRNSDALELATLDLDAGQSNDSGTNFRYADGTWSYNLSTTPLAMGSYVLTLQMPDGRRHNAAFVLR